MLVTFQEFKFGENKERLNLISSKSPQEPHFIYFPSVLKAFRIQDAVGFEANGEFRANGVIIDYMRDDSGFLYHPKRIPCIPGCVIEVLYKTPQIDSTSLTSTTTRESSVPLNESVDQLSIKSQLSINLDPSEPLQFSLPRKSTAQIQEDMKVVTEAMIARNRAGKPLDAHLIIDISLPAEYHTSIVSNVTDKSRFENRVMEELKEIRMDVKENLELSKQMIDRLILIQSKTEAILTQQLELAEYPIPRLFIVLPEETTKYDPGNWFRTKFRLHFICECGEHTNATGSKIPNHLHLAKHEGYLIREPTAFFKKYGPFLLLMLELIKFGTNIAGHVVPALVNLKVVELSDSVQQTVESVTAKIDYSLECIDKQLAKAQALSPGDFVGTEPRVAMTQRDLNDYLSDVEGLEGVELRQLGSFLKTSEEENLLGNLYRMTTSSGHVKWVCKDHYRASYQERHIQALREAVELAQGKFDEQMGRITITLTSTIAASVFYNAVSKAKGIVELFLSLDWKCTSSDLEKLEVALKNSSVSILWLDLRQFRSGFRGRFSSVQHVLFRIMEQFNMKMIHIVLSKALINLLTPPLKRPSHLCELSFETVPRSIGRKELKILSEALKTNSFLTTLNLSNNYIGSSGGEALASALKTNSTLTTLDLWSNSIGDSGGQALAEALETNSTLTILILYDNLIGDSGSQALAETLKTNSTLITLDLGGNSIRDSGGQALAEALKTNSTLTTLILYGNSIGDSGSQALAEALKTNSTLITLDLGGNSIKDSGDQALAEALKVNSTLTNLDLSWNSIGDSGSQAPAEALKTNSTLTNLNLDYNRDNRVGSGGGQALAEILKASSVLATLNLRGNWIGDSGGQWVWYQHLLRRFGNCWQRDIQELALDSPSSCAIPMDKLKEMYIHYSRFIVPAAEMSIIHLNGRHWELVECAGSTFNRVAELHGVWWLDVSAVFYGVPQGRYRIQWNCEMGRYFPALETEFRAVVTGLDEIASWGSTLPSAVSFTLSNEIQLMEQATHPDITSHESLYDELFILQIPDVLVINGSRQNVLVQFRNHNCSSYKQGLCVDYVRLVKEDDPRAWSPPTTTNK